MDKTIERLERNIQKLDKMISEYEKRVSVLQDSKLLMKKQISALKYHSKVSRLRNSLDMDKIISKIRGSVKKK